MTRLQQLRQVLVFIALVGWFGAIVTHFRSRRSHDPAGQERSLVRRNRFLLLSSLAMNTTVLSLLYSLLQRLRGFRSVSS